MKNLIVKLKLTATVSHQVQLLTPTIACMLSLVCAYIYTCIHTVNITNCACVCVCTGRYLYARMCECEREGKVSTNMNV